VLPVWSVDSFIVGDELRNRVRLLAERVGADRLLVEAGWGSVVGQFDLGIDVGIEVVSGAPMPPEGGHRCIAVGSPAFVLAHARGTNDEFGFVAPDARTLRRWQRGPSWRDDLTLRLWDEGWSVISVDRLTVPLAGSIAEFAVGSARRTPPPAVDPGSAAGRSRSGNDG